MPRKFFSTALQSCKRFCTRINLAPPAKATADPPSHILYTSAAILLPHCRSSTENGRTNKSERQAGHRSVSLIFSQSTNFFRSASFLYMIWSLNQHLQPLTLWTTLERRKTPRLTKHLYLHVNKLLACRVSRKVRWPSPASPPLKKY